MTSRMRRALELCLLGGAFQSAAALAAGTIEIDDERWVSVGAGLRAGYASTEDGAPDGSGRSNSFDVQNVRLYVSGSASERVKFTFNTECVSCTFGRDAADLTGTHGDITVLDAIAQFEFSPQVNVWVGRMLTPADRIELNGPFYGLSWNQYTVPLLPSDQLGQAGLFGRDDGVTFWGAAGKLQYAAGLFDGVDGGPNQDDNLLFAGRLAYNFLNMESNPGYYTSSTYYGELGDIFTLGVSYQSQADGAGIAGDAADFSAVILDMLYENALDGGGAITLEAEYKSMDAGVSTAAGADPSCFCLFDGESYFVTAAYMFAGSGMVKYQPYVRYTSNEPSAGVDSDLAEFGVNFVIRGHNARLNLNYTSGDANLTGAPGADVDTFSFNVQVQI